MIRYLINTYHNFYPRSPYGERLDGSKSSIEEVSFLSTLSLRRATYWSCVPVVGRSFLSTLSLRRATCYCSGRATSHRPFLSTLSLRRATGIRPGLWRAGRISIHALLAESDPHKIDGTASPTHFYPRSPCGERRRYDRMWQKFWHFYPRSPCGERLDHLQSHYNTPSISIHALLAESDLVVSAYPTLVCRFLSTLSLRRATMCHSGCPPDGS